MGVAVGSCVGESVTSGEGKSLVKVQTHSLGEEVGDMVGANVGTGVGSAVGREYHTL